MAIANKGAGAGAATETSGAACSPASPAVVDAGDILIIHAYFEGTTTAPNTPTGFTLLHGPVAVEAVGRHWIFGKIADGTEDGAANALGSQAVTTMRSGRCYSLSGRVSGSITDLVRGFVSTTHATDPQMPTVTTTVAGAMAVACVVQNDNNALGNATGESGGDWTEAVAEFVSALTPGLVLQVQTCTPTADPGTVSGGSVAATNDPSGVIGFEIRPSSLDHATTGAIVGPGTVVAGSAVHNAPHPTSGAIVGPGATVAGAASSATTRPSSGVLVGPGATLAGTAARTRVHATSGTIAGAGATFAGAASSATLRPSSGVLVGPGAVIAGVADSSTPRPSSGVLVGPGAVVAGSAARTGAPTVHATTGALAGPGAAVTGAASSKTTRTSSGVLVGPGAAVTGAASRVITHETSGALVGGGAELRGNAAAPFVGHQIVGYVDGESLMPRTRRSVLHVTSGRLVGKGAAVTGLANINRTGQNPLALLLIGN